MAAISEVNFSASPPCLLGDVLASNTPESPATDSLDIAEDITLLLEAVEAEVEVDTATSEVGESGATTPES